VVAVVRVSDHNKEEQVRGETLAERQRMDLSLRQVIIYLNDGVLPGDEKRARKLILGRSQYELLDGVSYRVETDKSLKIAVPVSDHERLFNEAHAGEFGGHLREVKMYSQLNHHYWWPGMRRDIVNWCHACFVCATRSVGKPIKSLLTPIPVSGPFDRVGVDVLLLPLSSRGNRMLLYSWITWPEVFPSYIQTVPTIAKLLWKKSLVTMVFQVSCCLTEVLYSSWDKTTAYHPQTNRRFIRTLLDMLAKKVKPGI